jgi:type I restriction enzyme, S subunit
MSSKSNTAANKDEARSALVPNLRFPEFRGAEAWDCDPLEHVADFVNEKIPLERVALENYVSTENILPDYGGVTRASKLPTTGSVTRYRPNDTLVSNIRPYLKKVWVADKEGGASNDVIVIRAKQKLLPQYFSCLLKNDAFIDYVMTGAKGVKMPRGDVGSMRAYPTFYPSKAEQQKIAECLSSVDNLMAAQARKVDSLRTHKKGLMQQLFPREGESQPGLRFPEFQSAGEWEETTLGTIAKLVRGPFGGSLKKEIFVASGYAVYEQQHAIYSDFSSFRYHITAEKFHELRRFAVAASDIIMSCSGTMGKFAIVPDGAAPGVINQALLKLTPNGFCDTEFLKEVLELPSVQERLLSQSAGGAIQNVVSVDQIKALPLRLPSVEEQRAVVGCLRSLDALITAETQKLGAIKTHKIGLMQQLFPSPEEVEA